MSQLSRVPGWSIAAFGVGLIAAASGACGGGSTSSGFGSTGDGGSGGSSGGHGGSGSSSGSLIDDSGTIGTFGDGGGSSSGSVGDAGCATATAKASKQPVYIEFVLDGSGSMAQDNKWTAVVPALQNLFTTVQKSADTGEGVGLMVFSDTNDPTHGGGPYPDGKDIPINFVGTAQESALSGRLGGGPGFGTPTGTALSGSYAYLESYAPMTPLPPGGQKVLVLITDGVPTGDMCDITKGNYANNKCVTMAAAELAKKSPNGPILTYVIGTGQFPSKSLTNYDPSFLGYLAQAGGTAPKGCNPAENTTAANLCYFSVDPTSGNATQTEMAFETAINAIRGQVLSCVFPLQVDSEAGALDPTKVNVTVNGTTVPEGAPNGWTYNSPTNPTQIIFNGTSCNSLKTDPSATVNIVLGCATVHAQ